MMASRRVLTITLMLALLAAPLAADAQPPPKIFRIGFLTAVPLSSISARTEAIRQGLRKLGYVEGKNIVIEWRSAEGQLDRLPSLAAELVRLKVDVIVTAGPSAPRPAKAATVTIPIVITNDNYPVANGFVASLARPGGNITGLSTLSPAIYGKQLELLKEIVPRLSRVAVLGTSTDPGNAQALRETERAARALRVQLQYLDVRDLPVEQPTMFELIINLKAAKQIGLTIPPLVLARADLVIE
jgi:putative tryptophan/tyrosine transport system substrate-binding protein